MKNCSIAYKVDRIWGYKTTRKTVSQFKQQRIEPFKPWEDVKIEILAIDHQGVPGVVA